MKKFSTDQYAGHPEGKVPLKVIMEEEAVELLRHLAPQRGMGTFLARLIYEHAAKIEERHALLQQFRNATSREAVESFGQSLGVWESSFYRVLDARRALESLHDTREGSTKHQ